MQQSEFDRIVNNEVCMRLYSYVSSAGYVVPIEELKDNNRLEAFIEDIPLNKHVNKDKEEDFDDIVKLLEPNEEKKQKQNVPSTVKDIVLRRCGQSDYLSFEKCYPNTVLKNCHKIGEGVYGEAFLYRNAEGSTSVMKIIPIEGGRMVNGEKQKKFEEILTEIITAEELSKLRTDKTNQTTSFCELRCIKCVKGKYPDRLVYLWELYDEDCGSQNDSPEIFDDDQIYIVLEFSNGGKDLEAFIFDDALQALAVFKQTVCALAVAESALKFEHRDLHWGNVLISRCDENASTSYTIDGETITLPTEGVVMSIIDFTMSRITADDGIDVFNDLALDPGIFDSKGDDYQFEIYKLMQKVNGNKWQHFEPRTNILWLHYLLDKLINDLRFNVIHSKAHKRCLKQLTAMKGEILNYRSAREYVQNKYM